MKQFNNIKKVLFAVVGGFVAILVISNMSFSVDSDAVMEGQKSMTASTYNRSKNVSTNGQDTKETIEGFFKKEETQTADDSAASGVEVTNPEEPAPYTPSTVDPGQVALVNPSSPDTPSSDGTILSAAADVMARAQAQGSTYVFGAGHGNQSYRNIPASMDCSGYVSLVLQEAGKIAEGTTVNSRGCLSLAGATLINNENDLQPGDILVTDSHVQIYAGNGTWYSWGRTSSTRQQPVPTNYTGYGCGQAYLGHVRF